MSFPIMKVNKIRVKNINTQNCQAILTTSFNSLTFLSDLIDNKNLKIFTLGLSSACYARNIGFKNVIDCDGDGDKMVSIILRKTRNDKGKIIYAGAKNISVNIPHILRNKGSSFIENSLLKAISRKPKGHDFNISKSGINISSNRHMSVTGG